MRLLLILACALVVPAAERPDLSGTWTLDASRNQAAGIKSGTLTIAESGQDVRIREAFLLATGKQNDFEVRCNNMGRECSLKDENEPVKVSLWHNGPALVMMETRKRGDVVTKKLFKLAGDGASLTMEIVPISPLGEKQTLVFAKK